MGRLVSDPFWCHPLHAGAMSPCETTNSIRAWINILYMKFHKLYLVELSNGIKIWLIIKSLSIPLRAQPICRAGWSSVLIENAEVTFQVVRIISFRQKTIACCNTVTFVIDQQWHGDLSFMTWYYTRRLNLDSRAFRLKLENISELD